MFPKCVNTTQVGKSSQTVNIVGTAGFKPPKQCKQYVPNNAQVKQVAFCLHLSNLTPNFK